MFDEYEQFTEEQLHILEHFVTNTKGHIFALRNLPEVIKGALFSRYSRSYLGLRSLLLKEFINNEDESGFNSIVGIRKPEDSIKEEEILAIKKAQNFYDRILDGYGDDSIGELGGSHLAIENVSMLAAKILEDSRIGGSPLEKSTRYIYFDQKVNGDYLFYREPILMTSAWRDLYLETCNMLFETYSKLIPPLTKRIEEKSPRSPEISSIAYVAAIRAKVLDCLRGLLPASTLTNMGIFGNGRFFEQLLHKLQVSSLAEVQEIGRRSFEELTKIIPSFIRRADVGHKTHVKFAEFYETMQNDLKLLTEQMTAPVERKHQLGVRMVSSDPQAVQKVVAGLLFAYSDRGLNELMDYCQTLPNEEILRIFDAASNARENRRHKSPRALEMAEFTFEIVADFGVYRDMQRHRILTQERQLLSCDYGYSISPEIIGTELEFEYREALERAKDVYDIIASELPEEAQYVVPMAYNIRWYFHVNLRALQWMCELRSTAQGHPNYRYIAQSMANLVSERFPEFERFFKFVDYEGYDLGRLKQEIKNSEKQEQWQNQM